MAESITPTFHVFTDEQLQAILTDRDEALRREERALAVAQGLKDTLVAIELGLVHYTKEQAATFFCCSTKQLERYEKDGIVKPYKMGNKVLYPVVQLQALQQRFQNAGIDMTLTSSFPKPKRHQ